MLNQEEPKDYVLSSGETHSIREFVEKAFNSLEIFGQWVGEGLDEKYISNGKTLVEVDHTYYRPAEVNLLLGDSSAIREELGWKPKNSFDNLVKKMVDYDLKYGTKQPS